VRTLTRKIGSHNIVQCFDDAGQPLDFGALRLELFDNSAILLRHAAELVGDIGRQFDTLALNRGRLGVHGLAFDVFQQIRSSAKELVMRKLPDLLICRSTLRTWRL